MFLDGLWRGDSGCHDSSLAGEVSRPLLFLITAWTAWADTFLLSDFPFCFNILCLWSKGALYVFLFMQKTTLSPIGYRKYLLFIALLLSSWLWYFSRNIECFSHLPPSRYADTSPCCHRVWLSEKSVWSPLFSLGLRGPFLSPLSYSALLCSAFLNTETLFFCNCACRWMSYHP